jgi:hypothetical protein
MKYRGEWRFLSEQEKFYYVYLEFDNGTEIILEIFDDIQNFHVFSQTRSSRRNDNFGKTGQWPKGYLRNCTFLSSGPYLDHFRITRIESQFVLIGGHYERIKLELDAIIVSFSNLNSFISYIDLFGETFSVLNRNTNTYERQLEIPEICRIRIFSQGSSFSSNNRVLFEIRSLGGKYLHNYIELMSILQDFF